MVFMERESLIFRIQGLCLQPKDMYCLCSFYDDWPYGRSRDPGHAATPAGAR
jgi:hypothetical protein